MLKNKDIVLVDVSGQYEFAQIHYIRDDGKYIAFTTRSGRVMGGRFDGDCMSDGNGGSYVIRPVTGAETGLDSAIEYFTDNA